MSYVGNTPTTQSFISGTDYFNGTGSQTAFTLSRTVNSVNDVEVVINNVVQQPNTAYTISGTTITFTSAPSAGTSNIYVRYLSTTTQAITPSQNTVSYSTLNSDTQSKLGISFKNRIINGACVIDQRNAGASVSTSSATSGYGIDRWQWAVSQNSKMTLQQNAGSVTPPAGFTNYWGVTSSSAYSLVSNDYFLTGQPIEGFNIADLGWGTANAKTVTLSFWVRSSLTGTFGASIVNSGNARSYVATYTINSANTWEQKTITIPGDTSGTWLTDNGVGLRIWFGLGVGSGYSGTAGTWSSTLYFSATGATSIVGTSGATWYMTGLQMEVGTQATTFDYRSYGTELGLCLRYAWVTNSDSISTGIGNGTTSAWCNIVIPVQMRTSPTATLTGTLCISDQVAYDASATSPTVVNSNLTSVGGRIQIGGWSASLTSYRVYTGTSAGGSGKVTLNAEL